MPQKSSHAATQHRCNYSARFPIWYMSFPRCVFLKKKFSRQMTLGELVLLKLAFSCAKIISMGNNVRRFYGLFFVATVILCFLTVFSCSDLFSDTTTNYTIASGCTFTGTVGTTSYTNPDEFFAAAQNSTIGSKFTITR